MDMFHLDPAPDWAPSLRVLTQSPRDMSPTTAMDTMDTTARGLLMPRLTLLSSTELMAMLVCAMLDMVPTPTPMEPTPMCMVSPLDPALVLTPSLRDLTPSPRVLMPPPRDMPPMPPMDMDTPMPMESK